MKKLLHKAEEFVNSHYASIIVGMSVIACASIALDSKRATKEYVHRLKRLNSTK